MSTRQKSLATFGDSGESDQSDEQPTADSKPMTHSNAKHPSNVHTEFSELNELPENVPICAEKAEIELANRARRRAIQEIGHHSTALRAFKDWCRDFGEPHGEPSREIGVSEFHMGGFSGSGEVSTADKAQALLAWMSNEHSDALEEVRQQYCEWIRDQCRKALEEQKRRERDERFSEHPPDEVNGWERFESGKPDVQVAYRGINHGTPCVATIYRDENGELDAFESTLEWWNEAETAAEANVNRHFVGVNERSVWGHLRRHLNTFDADSIESNAEPENEQTSEDREVKTRFRGAKNFDVVITIPVDGEHDITDSVTISGSSNAEDPNIWHHFSIEGEGPNTHYKFNSEKILDGWDGHERSEVFGESTDDTDSLDPISMDLPEGWELDTHMVGGNVDINGHRETAIFERTDGATVSVEMRNSEYTSNDYEVLSSFIGVPQVNGQLDSDLSKTDAYNLAVDHMADHPPEPDTESEPDAEAAEVATDGGVDVCDDPHIKQLCYAPHHVGQDLVDGQLVGDGHSELLDAKWDERESYWCTTCDTEFSSESDAIEHINLANSILATDGGQVETIPTVDPNDPPANETVRLITGVNGLMHSPRIVEGETSSSGKTIAFEDRSGRSYRLDSSTIFNGDCEFRDGGYYEIYTPERYRSRQRSNRAPGPQAGANGVSDADELPPATHRPPGEDERERKRQERREQAEKQRQERKERMGKWDLSKLSRGDLLLLDGYEGEFVVTRINTFATNDTVRSVDIAKRDGDDWENFEIKRIDTAGDYRLSVTPEDDTRVFVDVNDPGHARDFEVIGNDETKLRRWVREDYYSEYNDDDDDTDRGRGIATDGGIKRYSEFSGRPMEYVCVKVVERSEGGSWSLVVDDEYLSARGEYDTEGAAVNGAKEHAQETILVIEKDERGGFTRRLEKDGLKWVDTSENFGLLSDAHNQGDDEE